MRKPELSVLLGGDLPTNDLVHLAREVETLGFSRIWLSEDLYFRGAIPRAAAVLASTARIGVGFGVLTCFHRHPAALAMDLAALLELGPNRVTLGLGAGVGPFIERMGIAYEHPLAAVSDTAVIVQQMLAGAACTHEGKVFSARGVKFDFTPAASPLPLYLGVMGPQALRLAGRLGDGVVLTLMTSIPYVHHALAQVRAGATAAGRPAGTTRIAAYFPFSVDADGARARAALKPMMARVFARWRGKPALERMFTEFGGMTEAQLDAIIAGVKGGGRPEDLVPDSVVDTFSVAGSPKECLARLGALHHAGVDEVVIAVAHGVGGPQALIQTVSQLLLSREAV